MVFDEDILVPFARCYLNGIPYRGSHNPPLAALLVTLSIAIFGDNPLGWRLPGALLGTALVGITYLLARRMFGRRLAGFVAGGMVICDGLFLTQSRLALWEIPYLTLAACSYLLLFRFMAISDPRASRGVLGWLALTVGLCLGSKVLIPGLTAILVGLFVAFAIVRASPENWNPLRVSRTMIASMALFGGLSLFAYESVFIPNFWFGWWHGIIDQLAYYRWIFNNDTSLGPKGHPYASPWWSWPLMLRPVQFFYNGSFLSDPNTKLSAIVELANPVIIFGVLGSIPLIALRAVRQRDAASTFVTVGYLLYMAMWIPIRRFTFEYHYMPAMYLGSLALAHLLGESWQGNLAWWEEMVLLATLLPPLVLGAGSVAGLTLAAATFMVYLALRRLSARSADRFVTVLFAAFVLVAFVYFFPIWTAIPLSQASFQHRMWLHGPGLANWI